MIRDEQNLLANYKEKGDLELLGDLYKPYMPLIYGLCLKYYKNPVQSEDAVMQIFESLITKLRAHEVTNFKSWLYTLARNHCLMDLRQAAKQQIVDIDDYMAESDEALFAGESGGVPESQLALMEDCLKELNEAQRVCVKLFYLEQKCYKDIAGLTGYEQNQVKSYIQNGKRNLKICMIKKSNIADGLDRQ